MSDTNGSHRLDRIEAALALLLDDHVQFREEHKQLLTAQVVLVDSMDKLTKRMDQLALAQIETTEKLNGLIGFVAGMDRQPKPPQ